MSTENNIHTEWVHLAYDERSVFNETYGFAGNQGKINVEGLRLRPAALTPSDTLLVYMHPSSTMQLLPVPRAMAASGAHVLCAGSRYQRNDSALIMEKVLLDLGAYIRHAKEVWKYRHVVLVGWSGGGSLAATYQSQAESPTITHTPGGDPVNLVDAGLIPADAVIWQAAHLSRAHLLAEGLDPSVRDELNPDDRDPELDIYDPSNPNQPPYTPEYIARYRAAQMARMRRITAWAKATLARLKERNGAEMERGFVVHRTYADPRFMDPSLDPNGRKPRWSYLGNPEAVNNGPIGLGRFSTLRSWISQWSLDDTCANGLKCIAKVRAPVLVIENGADDAVPQPHSRMLFEAATSSDKRFHLIPGATHYYAGQPDLMNEVTQLIRDWLGERGIRI
ncbi:alpha/beta fold hydrolase [Hydrogenophaga sp. YM1]|uniref:alpha/beta hydrolase family protein n=1 Tax=Hydrogenophaga sp. YM1 TaxID=2806262 RepID=UPI00195A6AF7|nr:alpha/beta fold hydrolase [Hydrogenophaga sp. YM1]QRR34008.1 alpha/beta fold hydrolase [Hydrogenophaga sp. YM1]